MSEYIVLGLGTFGRSLALELQSMGNEVVGVDIHRPTVQSLRLRHNGDGRLRAE